MLYTSNYPAWQTKPATWNSWYEKITKDVTLISGNLSPAKENQLHDSINSSAITENARMATASANPRFCFVFRSTALVVQKKYPSGCLSIPFGEFPEHTLYHFWQWLRFAARELYNP